MNSYYFLCSKFSDLDNMLPVLHKLLEKDDQSKSVILWYGKSISSNSLNLINYVRSIHDGREIYFFSSISPGIVKDELNKFQKIKYYTRKLIQEITKRVLLKYDSKKELTIANAISKRIIDDNLNNKNSFNVFFFGFKGRRILDIISRNVQNGHKIWVRLPQGVRLTINAFRTEDDLFKPSSPDNYIPDWADVGIDVDRHMYDKVSQIRKTLGHNEAQSKKIKLLGAPRFSREWIAHLDIAYQNQKSSFAVFDNNRSNVLFLLTPWQKNVWKDEVLRVMQIISYYDVNLVIKGFHGNTKLPINQYSFVIDEKTPSSALIRDADAIIFIATSVALEGYVRGKEMLQLSYVHGNQTILEDNNMGVMAHCRDDVHLFVNNLVRKSIFSLDLKVKQNAETFVVNNIVGTDPMNAYAEHIMYLSEQYRNPV